MNKARRKRAKKFPHDDFSSESLQHIEVIIDRDDYFPFSVTAIQRDSQVLLFLTLLLFACLCENVRKESQKSNRKTNSSCIRLSELIHGSRSQKHPTSFLCSCRPSCLLLFCLPNPVLFLSLCEVCSSCCFPCRAYNNVF